MPLTGLATVVLAVTTAIPAAQLPPVDHLVSARLPGHGFQRSLVSAAAPLGATHRSRPRPRRARARASRHPVLRLGASGPAVREVQRRLARLRFDPGPADGRFGRDLLVAVWAFQKANGRSARSVVDQRFWRDLRAPRRIRPMIWAGGPNRIEIDLRRQLLSLYHHGRLALVTHISTGTGRWFCAAGRCAWAVTPRGDFRVYKRINGWHEGQLGDMYRPLFFDGALAMHGSTEVPRYRASHGCVRIPLYQSFQLYGRVPIGTPVYVR